MRKKTLIVNPRYYPGFRSGGPQQTVMNVAEAFGDRYDLYVLTQNCDLGDDTPYPQVPIRVWVPVGRAKVKYLPPAEYGFRALEREYRQFERILTCGLLDKNSVLLLAIHAFHRRENRELTVAPMGVFSPGALGSKALKKQIFLKTYRFLGFFRHITWAFTSQAEREYAVRALGERAVARYVIAEDLPRRVDFAASRRALGDYRKEPGTLRAVFLSRISPMKNLDYCAKILAAPWDGRIEFDVYGAAEDEAYLARCRAALRETPDNVIVRFRGPVRPENVVETLREYDLFFLPTRGENFGHAIYEALAAGCVPLISDRTPWNGIGAAGCGYALPLEGEEAFREVIRRFLAGDREFALPLRAAAIDCAEEKYAAALADSGYERIFEGRR